MTRARTPRPAFTLLEVLLVIAILVAIGAAAFPTLEGLYRDVREKAAADVVRAAWSEARARAIEDGRSYRFAVQPGTGNFRVAPDTSFSDGTLVGDDEAPPYTQEEALPGSILFEVPGDLPAEGGWTTVAIFNPDGTCNSDTEITLKTRDDGPAITVRVRAMTGAITVRNRAGEGR